MRLTINEIVRVTAGNPAGDRSAAEAVEGVATDSRAVVGGELFVPLRDRRDGHDWIPAALAAGAAAYLTEADPVGGTAVQVADTSAALWALADHARSRIDAPVVGVTGSVGKTTTKDMIRALLATRFATHASRRSFNNQIGVPLTILGAPDDTQAHVLELGARAVGDIAHLCTVARPTIGVVTKVAAAHTEVFGSLDAVARAKRELVEALPETGTAVLNADDPRIAAMASATRAAVIRFGASGDVRAEILDLDTDLRPLVRLSTPAGTFDVRISARGAHQADNAAAAVAVAHALAVPLPDIVAGLEVAELSPMRMELTLGPGGAQIIDDCYNANPASMEAALHSLAALQAKRRVAVLGIMAELGDLEEPEHRRIGQLARDLGIEVIAVATPHYGAEQVANPGAAVERLGELAEGDAVLIKGSRVAELERVAAALKADP